MSEIPDTMRASDDAEANALLCANEAEDAISVMMKAAMMNGLVMVDVGGIERWNMVLLWCKLFSPQSEQASCQGG